MTSIAAIAVLAACFKPQRVSSSRH